jgi:hypothetical protein
MRFFPSPPLGRRENASIAHSHCWAERKAGITARAFSHIPHPSPPPKPLKPLAPASPHPSRGTFSRAPIFHALTTAAILAVFRIGYTGRRSGEAGPARLVEGETQNLVIRVRGKWSSSGDTGEAGKPGPAAPFPMPETSAPGVPVRHTEWPTDWFCRVSMSTTYVGKPAAENRSSGRGRRTGVAGTNSRTGR